MRLENEVGELSFTTGELRTLPKAQLGFFVGSCIAINEIVLLNKLLLMTLNSSALASKGAEHEIVRSLGYASGVIAQRNLSAKVFEYLYMVEQYLKTADRAKHKVMMRFRESASALLLTVRSMPEHELADWYRDTVTNHYIVSKIADLVVTGDLGDANTEHPIYLHEADGNSAYLLGEQVLMAKLHERGADPVAQIKKLDDWVLGTTKRVGKLHSAFCIELMDTYFPDKVVLMKSITTDERLSPRLTDAMFPVLWNLGPPRKPRLKR